VVSAYDAVLVERYLPAGYVTFPYDPAATPELTRALGCDRIPAPCGGTAVDLVLWDDLLRAEGPGWQEVRMAHGARLRVAHVARAAAARVRQGLGGEIVP